MELLDERTRRSASRSARDHSSKENGQVSLEGSRKGAMCGYLFLINSCNSEKDKSPVSSRISITISRKWDMIRSCSFQEISKFMLLNKFFGDLLSCNSLVEREPACCKIFLSCKIFLLKREFSRVFSLAPETCSCKTSKMYLVRERWFKLARLFNFSHNSMGRGNGILFLVCPSWEGGVRGFISPQLSRKSTSKRRQSDVKWWSLRRKTPSSDVIFSLSKKAFQYFISFQTNFLSLKLVVRDNFCRDQYGFTPQLLRGGIFSHAINSCNFINLGFKTIDPVLLKKFKKQKNVCRVRGGRVLQCRALGFAGEGSGERSRGHNVKDKKVTRALQGRVIQGQQLIFKVNDVAQCRV